MPTNLMHRQMMRGFWPANHGDFPNQFEKGGALLGALPICVYPNLKRAVIEGFLRPSNDHSCFVSP